jgi:dihydroflavonol-4-reductase
MKRALDVLAEVTGLPAPKFRLPYTMALGVAHVNEWWSGWTGKPPRAPLAGVRMARYKMFFKPDKAIRELGLPQTDPREALSDAVEWFRANGYIRKK